jgi:dimethylargininase
MNFSRAVVRPPARTFAAGLTHSTEGTPDPAQALAQHRAYCHALEQCGLELTHLDPDDAFPDGTFVEDTAIVTGRGAVLTHPGAPSRRGEVASVAECLHDFFGEVARIAEPGTLDGGDVCESDGQFLIGLSGRTNEAGALQLQEFLRRMGYRAQLVDIRSSATLLHLKTGIAYLGDNTWVAEREGAAILASLRLPGARMITVEEGEGYAANCVRVNDSVLLPEGYPRAAAALRAAGFRPRMLEVSEFRKMDGGLSCLSLRF